MRNITVDFFIDLYYNMGVNMVNKNKQVEWSIDRERNNIRYKDYNQLYRSMYNNKKKLSMFEVVYLIVATAAFSAFMYFLIMWSVNLTK